MKRKGGITVFLSLCLLCVSALICVMVEGARTAGSRFYFQVAVNASLDTLFSQYHRELWKQYRILGLTYESEEDLINRLESYMEPYLKTENWYPISLEGVEVCDRKRLTDENGDFFAEEVLAYMKYGIWSQLELDLNQGETFWNDIREASSAGTMTGVYDGQEKEVERLEKAVEKILLCVEKQESYAQNIKAALDQDDAEQFHQEKASFRREAGKMESLITAYERRAEQLKQALSKGAGQFQDMEPDFQEDRKQLFETQMNPYYAYVEEDGKRYQEVLNQKEVSLANLELLQQTEELVEQLEEEAEGQEENDSEDELSLASAAEMWDGFCSTKLNLERQKGDQEKKGFLEQVRQMAEGGLLQIVLPEGMEVSKGVISARGLPSSAGLKNAGQNNQKKEPVKEPGTEGIETAAGIKTIAEQMLVHEYCGAYFSHALSETRKPIQYEMEYLLQGNPSDRENLEQTVSQIFLIRQGLNLIHILSDGEKREEARSLAAIITGVSGLAPLVEIAACFIMVVWAMGEAVMDLRLLLSGNKVPLWKKREDWSLSLEGLLSLGKEGRCADPGSKTEKISGGMSYISYLKLLLLIEDNDQKQMRMLDIIQMNLQREEPGFSMNQCICQVDIRGRGCGKHVFFALPVVENFLHGEPGYPLEAVAGKRY